MENRRIIVALGWILLMLGCLVYDVYSFVTAVDPTPGFLVGIWLAIPVCSTALAVWCVELHKAIKDKNKYNDYE